MARTIKATPYEVVVLDPEQRAVIKVNLDSGVQTIWPGIPLTSKSLISGGVVAVAQDRTTFVLGNSGAPPTRLAELPHGAADWKGRWIDRSTTTPNDMDVMLSGNPVYGGDSGVFEIDLRTGTKHRVAVTPAEGELDGPRTVEVDSTGRIIASVKDGNPTILFRQLPGGVDLEGIETGLYLTDYVLESDSTLIGLGKSDRLATVRDVYRIDVESGESEMIFRSHLLRRSATLAVDPAGRVITLSQPLPDEPFQLVRIDLATGDTDVFDLDESFGGGDFELLIIPEPSTFMLLAVGLFAAGGVMRHRKHSTRSLG
jgi:hypothetical protein